MSEQKMVLAIIRLVNDWLEAEDAHISERHTYMRMAQSDNFLGGYAMAEGLATQAWNALRTVCYTMWLDTDTVVSTVKSIIRTGNYGIMRRLHDTPAAAARTLAVWASYDPTNCLGNFWE